MSKRTYHMIRSGPSSIEGVTTLCSLVGRFTPEPTTFISPATGKRIYAVHASNTTQGPTCERCRKISSNSRSHSLAHMRKLKW